jgi:hypothetical protein
VFLGYARTPRSTSSVPDSQTRSSHTACCFFTAMCLPEQGKTLGSPVFEVLQPCVPPCWSAPAAGS